MSDLNDRVMRDLGVHLLHKLQEIMERDMNVARAILPPADLVLMMIETSAAICNGACTLAVQFKSDEITEDALCDKVLDAIRSRADSMREKALEALASALAAQSGGG